MFSEPGCQTENDFERHWSPCSAARRENNGGCPSRRHLNWWIPSPWWPSCGNPSLKVSGSATPCWPRGRGNPRRRSTLRCCAAPALRAPARLGDIALDVRRRPGPGCGVSSTTCFGCRTRRAAQRLVGGAGFWADQTGCEHGVRPGCTRAGWEGAGGVGGTRFSPAWRKCASGRGRSTVPLAPRPSSSAMWRASPTSCSRRSMTLTAMWWR